MKRTIFLSVAALAAFGICARSLAAVTGVGTASVQVAQAAGVNIVTPLVLPTVSTTAVVSTPQVTTATSSAGSGVGSNATLTITGQSGDAVSMAVPETFQVVRAGGTETLTVKTNTNAQYNVADNGVMVGGTNADTMSVNVGGTLSLASADDLVPGPYEGLLVVVVQYN